MEETKKEVKIYKYPTGAVIPEGAIYLGTTTQTEILGTVQEEESGESYTDWIKCWLVWHYFLVEVENSNNIKE